MNRRQLRLIAIALAVLLGLWGLSEIIAGGRDEVETAMVLPPLQMTEVDTVTIASPSDTVALANSGGGWTVNGFETSPSELEAFFGALGDSSEAELISTGESMHKRMGVDDESGTHMRFVNGGSEVAHVVFGKSGRRYNSRYVRPEGSDYTYLYLGDLSRYVGRKVDDWRNKRIADLQPDSIQMIAVSRGRERYTLIREGDGWRFSTGEATDSAAVSRLLSQYSGLNASGFATEAQADSADFSRPDRTVTVVGQPGDTLVALVFDSTSAAYWVRRSSGGTIYRILQWKANQMTPAESTLVADTARGEGSAP